jgi:tetratricopeptide (TPR) repeat protein
MPFDVKVSRDEQALLFEAAILYRDRGLLKEAREVLEGLRALSAPADLVEVQLGLIDWQEGQFDQAARHYRQALDRNPKSALAAAHFGELEIFRKNRDSAKSYLRQALELDPRGASGKLARSLMALV